ILLLRCSISLVCINGCSLSQSVSIWTLWLFHSVRPFCICASKIGECDNGYRQQSYAHLHSDPGYCVVRTSFSAFIFVGYSRRIGGYGIVDSEPDRRVDKWC